jgi:hypothetical protein
VRCFLYCFPIGNTVSLKHCFNLHSKHGKYGQIQRLIRNEMDASSLDYVCLMKLIVAQVVKKFPFFCRSLRFITFITGVLHRSWTSCLICSLKTDFFPSTFRCLKWLLLVVFSYWDDVWVYPVSSAYYIPRPSRTVFGWSFCLKCKWSIPTNTTP